MAAVAASMWPAPQEEGIREICGLLERQISLDFHKHLIWKQVQHYSQVIDFNNYFAFILAFEEAELARLKEEKPGLTLTQYRDMVWKLWKKSPDNPLNQQASE